MSVILTARCITKKFPGVIALKDVSFDLQVGEIHALCGENGAGKSTLIKLLSGIHPYGSYEGCLKVQGKEARFAGIGDASKAGIAVIYQELALVEEMSVAENIFLGCEPRRWGGFIDWSRIYREANDLLKRFKVPIDPAALVSSLGVGQKQLVEIVKALAKNSRILILDEPTAALAEHEVLVLIGILRDLRQRGIACIYISHKLDEVFGIADRITVLRDGSTIATQVVKDTCKADVIRRMVGREISDFFPRRVSQPGEILLKVQKLTVCESSHEAPKLHQVSFELKSGEVLGIGGLMGAGRTELLMHLFGVWGYRQEGEVTLRGDDLKKNSPRESIDRGMVLASEDRRRYGLVLEHGIGFNLSLSSLKTICSFGFIRKKSELKRNQSIFEDLCIKATGLDANAGRLSGGNQQKIVLGKALLVQPSVILLDEPTRGIDVGAKLEIYEIINQLTSAGKAVVLVSSELPELIGMSDRILMLREGRIAGEFNRSDFCQEKLLQTAVSS